jgi:polysaccharide export outer membrane protein
VERGRSVSNDSGVRVAFQFKSPSASYEFRNFVGKKLMKKNYILLVWVALALASAQTTCIAQEQPVSSAAASAGARPSTADTPSSTSPVSASIPQSAAGNAPQFGTRDTRYRIAASDSFDITFPLTPEYNQLGVTVQPDGFVTLYGIGDVKVQGQTVPELTDTVKQTYERLLNDPIITIVLKDFNKPYFIADGQVGHPGKYDLRADTTLTEAIAIAGGFTEDSKHSQVVLYRRVNDQWASAELIDVKKMENNRNLREDPYLHPGDMLFVPKSRISKIKGYLPSSGVGAYVPIK